MLSRILWRPPQVQKSAEHYTEAARDEIQLLVAVASKAAANPSGAAACVRLLDSFDHRGPHGRHVCMVFEVCHPVLHRRRTTLFRWVGPDLSG